MTEESYITPKHSRVLGLDIGTSSIGWALIDHDEECMIDWGVRLFTNSRDAKSKESLAVPRREARLARRQLDRRMSRKRMIYNHVFAALDLQHLKNKEKGKPARKFVDRDPVKCRMIAADRLPGHKALPTPEQLARALIGLGVHRGYKSNARARRQATQADVEKLLEKDNATMQQAAKQTDEKKANLLMITHLEEVMRDPKQWEDRPIGVPTDRPWLLCEFLFYARKQYNQTSRFRPTGALVKNQFYPDREMYEDEFEAIRTHCHAMIADADWDTIHDAIFDQRDLRPVEAGKCRYIQGEARAPKYLPTTYAYAIAQDAANLAAYHPTQHKGIPLTIAQGKEFMVALNRQKSFAFKKLAKQLGMRDGYSFNLEKAKDQANTDKNLKGNVPLVDIAKLLADRFDPSTPIVVWDKLIETALKSGEDEDKFIELLEEEDLAELDTQVRADKDFMSALLEKITHEHSGHSAMSRQFMHEVLETLHEWLAIPDAAPDDAATFRDLFYAARRAIANKYGKDETGESLDAAAHQAHGQLKYYGEVLEGRTQNHPIKQKTPDVKELMIAKIVKDAQAEREQRENEKNPLQKLPPRAMNYEKEIDHGRIANPTVHRVLNQLRILINELIILYPTPEGRPAFDRIHVELARDLKQTQKQREAIDKANKDNAGNRKRNYETAQGFIPGLSEADFTNDYAERMRFFYRLRGDAKTCLYCGKPIELRQLFNNETQIDHIIPYSRSFDNFNANRLLVHLACNQEKGARTPAEWQPGGEILERAKRMYLHGIAPGTREEGVAIGKLWRFTDTAMENMKDGSDFANRQLKDTQYASKIARLYVRSLVEEPHHVISLKGQLTSLLRDKWDIMGKCGVEGGKSRNDHRHHAVDALIIALSELRTIQQIDKISGRTEDKKSMQRVLKPIDLVQQFPSWVKRGRKDDADLKDSYTKLVVSAKTNHDNDGRIYKETAYGEPKLSRTALGDDQAAQEEKKLIGEFDATTSMAIDAYIALRSESLNKDKERNARTLAYDSALRTLIDDAIRKHIPALEADIAAAKETKRDNKDPQPIPSLVERVQRELHSTTAGNRDVAPIRHIRIMAKKGSAVSIKSAPYKKYDTDGYSKVIIWAQPIQPGAKDKLGTGYEFVPRFVPIFAEQAANIEPWLYVCHAEAAQNKILRNEKTFADVKDKTSFDLEKIMKPHPEAKLFMELRKRDTIALPTTDEAVAMLTKYGPADSRPNPTIIIADGQPWILATIALFSATNLRVTLTALNDATPSPKGPTRYLAELIADYNLHRCHVSASGKVRILPRPKWKGGSGA